MSQLAELSPHQRDQLCAEVDAFVLSSAEDQVFKELLCRSAGVSAAATSSPATDADARAACAGAYDACETGAISELSSCSETCAAATCTATIRAYAACINDEPPVLAAAAPAVPSCDTLTLADSR